MALLLLVEQKSTADRRRAETKGALGLGRLEQAAAAAAAAGGRWAAAENWSCHCLQLTFPHL